MSKAFLLKIFLWFMTSAMALCVMPVGPLVFAQLNAELTSSQAPSGEPTLQKKEDPSSSAV